MVAFRWLVSLVRLESMPEMTDGHNITEGQEKSIAVVLCKEGHRNRGHSVYVPRMGYCYRSKDLVLKMLKSEFNEILQTTI